MAKDDDATFQYIDEINRRLAVAGSILDCATVLSALQGMPPVKVVDFATGDGYANGFQLNPHSLPEILVHAREMIVEAKADANLLHDFAKHEAARR